jgi:hypothetical protein
MAELSSSLVVPRGVGRMMFRRPNGLLDLVHNLDTGNYQSASVCIKSSRIHELLRVMYLARRVISFVFHMHSGLSQVV